MRGAWSLLGIGALCCAGACFKATDHRHRPEPQPPMPDATWPVPALDAGGFGNPQPGSVTPTVLCERSNGFREDHDGLPLALEMDAGLDGCDDDTDHDGCPDAAEYYLGGCDDPERPALFRRCFTGGPPRAEVRFTLPADRGPWDEVVLRLPQFERVTLIAYPLEALPSGAAEIAPAGFRAVQPGAGLRFAIEVEQDANSNNAFHRGRFAVVGDGRTLFERPLIVGPDPICPTVI